MAPTKLVLPFGRIPPKWDPNTAREINEDFQDLVNFVNALKTQVDNITLVAPSGTRGPEGRAGMDGLDGEEGRDSLIPGGRGDKGDKGDKGDTGASGSGGGGMTLPYFPESFIPDDAPDLFPIPGMALASQLTAASATVAWGTPTVLALDVDFTFATDGVVVLYNTISQGGTFKINGSVIGGVATNQSSTCGFPYSSGQTGHIVSGGAGSGLTAAFYPFTGGCGWGAPSSITLSTNFTETASGLVLITNSNNQASTYVLNAVTYAETSTDTNDSVGVPYIAGQTAQVTAGGAGSGLTANFYPFTGNGAWAAPVSLSTGVDFTETASGLIVSYNSGNQGSTLSLNGASVGGVFNTNHHASNNPYTAGQTAHITLVGGSGFLAWFFGLPSSTSGSGTVVTGGNFSSNVASSVVGSPVVFGDTSGKLGTLTLNRLTLAGTGHPQGVVAAAVGYQYVDINTGYLYYKAGGGSTAFGWFRLIQMGAGPTQGMCVWNGYPDSGAASTVGASAIGAFAGAAAANFFGAGITTSSRTVSGGKTYATLAGIASSGTITGLSTPGSQNSGTTANPFPLDDDIDMTIDMLTGPSVANMRFWFGLTSNITTNADTLGAGGAGSIAFRYSTVAGDGGFVGTTQATTNQTVSATVAAIAASTIYLLRVRFVRQGTPTVYFSVNHGTEVSITTHIPATGAVYFPDWKIVTTAAAVQTIGWRQWGATLGS